MKLRRDARASCCGVEAAVRYDAAALVRLCCCSWPSSPARCVLNVWMTAAMGHDARAAAVSAARGAVPAYDDKLVHASFGCVFLPALLVPVVLRYRRTPQGRVQCSRAGGASSFIVRCFAMSGSTKLRLFRPRAEKKARGGGTRPKQQQQRVDIRVSHIA